MNPIITIDNRPAPKKLRTIRIFKPLVYQDIDRITFKHADVSGIPEPSRRDSIASDVHEHLDGAIIERYVEYRHARLCKKLQRVLSDEDVLSANDGLPADEGVFFYKLELNEQFNDSTLRALAEFIHRYLVWGVLYDWYSQFGMQQAAVYGAELKEIEDSISGALNSPSIRRRPMQPFGPAERII